MIPISRLLPWQARAYSFLFFGLALAAFQNVTVDDAVLIGPVVPHYLPSLTDWNAGNTCTACYVQPDPTLVYNGTWHDATYSPSNGFFQAIQFTFTGTALYIFFIMANNITDTTTFTDVEFLLDGISSSRYTHTPGATDSYQYNVPVYVNESLGYGQHDMTIQPVNSGQNVLILFDYFVYTTNASSSVSPSVQTTSTSPPASVTSSGTQGTSSGQNTGAIAGGVAGGTATLVVVAAVLLCYRRYKRRSHGQRSQNEEAVVEPFYYADGVAATPSMGQIKSPSTEPVSGVGLSIVTQQPRTPPASTTPPSSSGAEPGASNVLLEQVERLREEVALLREMRDAPPEYPMNELEWAEGPFTDPV